MDPRAESRASDRLRLLARLFLLWGLLVLGRLIQLQVFDSAEYRKQAERQHEREFEVRAPRGSIFDRNGQAVAMSTAVESVCINPQRTADPEGAAELLSKTLQLDYQTLLSKISIAKESGRGFLWIKRKITDEEARKVRGLGVDWIEFRNESTRFYPKGRFLAHVLGGVDHQEKGNAGIELALNSDLTGKAGVIHTRADVRRKVYRSEVETGAEPGANIRLSIDERIQFVAERELAAAVKEHHADTGSLVVMVPDTGEILAIANVPDYDPNEAPKKGEDPKPRRNLAVGAPFEPGSVFKIVTVSAALETTRLHPGSVFHCGNGSMVLFRRVIHDAKPHGYLTMADIIAKSSNIGSIKIGLEVGNQPLYDYIKKFGFGKATGLPLPGESGGVVRRLDRWIKSSIGSVAMGHELSATTVQLAQACSVIANGGFRVKPLLVLEKHKPGAQPERFRTAERVQIMRPDNAMKMRMMMEGVVLSGTGKAAQLSGYSSAGKTGSAQIYDYAARVYTHRYNGSFMGFAPVTNPRIVVVVTLNGTTKYGGVVAAPVFNKVATAALRYLDVPRDLPESLTPEKRSNKGDIEPDLAIAEMSLPPDLLDDEQQPQMAEAQSAPRPVGPELPPYMQPKGPKTPDFQGKSKRAVLEQSAASGIRVEIAGSGIARRQEPAPGSVLRPGERVKVTFAP